MFLLATRQATLAQAPQYSGKVTLQGLQQNVEVFFDKFGIPHIYAKSLEDAYFGLGYTHAQERISQFEYFRRSGTGTLSEVLGEAGLSNDVSIRSFGVTENARVTAEAFRRSPNTKFKRSLTAYLAGVNAYLASLTPETRPRDLLPTPERYTITDIFATSLFFQFGFPSIGLSSDLLTTQLKNALDNPAYFKELKVLTGRPVNRSFPARASFGNHYKHKFKRTHKPMSSKFFKKLKELNSQFVNGFKNSNGWAISGRKSTTGKPFMSSDAHVALFKPDLFYEAQIVYPGQDLYGLFFPLSNLCAIGHNQHTSWGVTAMLNDDLDLYREEINPENPQQVKFRGKWVNLKVRKETILVKGGDPITIDVNLTPHGPLINGLLGLNDTPISMFYTGYKFADRFLEAFFGINNAKNLRQFKRAASKHIAPGYNVQYADKDGHIAWFAVAKLLKRPNHVNPKMILDGASGNDEPLGFYPFSKNPRSIDPPSGFIYSANNQIGRVDGKLYPGYYVAGTRAKKIRKIFRRKAKFSSKDLQNLFNDNTSDVFRRISRDFLLTIRNTGVMNKTADHQKVAEILRSWKGEHTLDTKGPIVFYQLYYQLLSNIFEDELGAAAFQSFFTGSTPLYDVIDRSFIDIYFKRYSIWYDDVTTTNKKESRTEILARAFDRTVERLVANQVLNKTWGEAHQQTYIGVPALFAIPAEFTDFIVGPFPFEGGINVLNKTELDLLAVNTSGDYNVAKTNGPANRNLVDFSDIRNKSLGILPTGQSGFPNSQFYQDQASLYNTGQLRPMLGTRANIEKQSSKLILAKPQPNAPNVGDISGATNVCPQEHAVKYSVDPVSNADYYIWTLPAGVSQSNTGASNKVITTQSYIKVDFGTGFNGGNITVMAENYLAGTGTTSTLAIAKCTNARVSNFSEALKNKEVVLHPNPVKDSDWINIKVNGYKDNTAVYIQVVNLAGSLVKEIDGKLTSGKLAISSTTLPKGVSILKVKVAAETYSFKVIN
ncbi:hypothetical protein BKI52_06880 [marine bacterium AO1-C]|nr:hypothetical protein BKI52_06880 [marine bacterium AO1-C]